MRWQNVKSSVANVLLDSETREKRGRKGECIKTKLHSVASKDEAFGPFLFRPVSHLNTTALLQPVIILCSFGVLNGSSVTQNDGCQSAITFILASTLPSLTDILVLGA